MKIENDFFKLFKSADYWFERKPREVKGLSSVTFKHCAENVDLDGFEKSVYTTQIIDLQQTTDQIWGAMHAKSCRYKINRSVREGVEVVQSQDFESFYRMHTHFTKMKKLGSSGFSLDRMRRYGTLFLAYYDSELIAGSMYVESNEAICMLLASSNRFENSQQLNKIIGFANKHIIWEVIQYAHNKGIKEFDFGGIYTGETPDIEKENINNVKLSFGGRVVKKYNYYKSYNYIHSFLKFIYRGLHFKTTYGDKFNLKF